MQMLDVADKAELIVLTHYLLTNLQQHKEQILIYF